MAPGTSFDSLASMPAPRLAISLMVQTAFLHVGVFDALRHQDARPRAGYLTSSKRGAASAPGYGTKQDQKQL